MQPPPASNALRNSGQTSLCAEKWAEEEEEDEVGLAEPVRAGFDRQL